MEFFLRPENEKIWAEVQELAHKSDLGSLQSYVAVAQRLTSPFKLVHYAAQEAEAEGKKITPENIMIMTLVSPPCSNRTRR